ncbi:hypothetical protein CAUPRSCDRAFT_12434 [Caulochytrium protostelioides]|uniref:Uncharacterized protein n=1 Tax=Caulochytrium protostelioides TaxID=1555241 RepID=A0A4P9WX75_9FUNG|nr:hypothetical protein CAUPRSCDRAFT_12434 [Caulochytrium protostelioides]
MTRPWDVSLVGSVVSVGCRGLVIAPHFGMTNRRYRRILRKARRKKEEGLASPSPSPSPLPSPSPSPSLSTSADTAGERRHDPPGARRWPPPPGNNKDQGPRAGIGVLSVPAIPSRVTTPPSEPPPPPRDPANHCRPTRPEPSAFG